MSGISLDELVDIQITDGTDSLAINADGSLNVNFASGAAVEITDGVETLAINADGSINITDNGGSITVDATDLDIRDLTHVSDSVKVGDGTDFLAVNADGSLNVNLTDDGIADGAADSGNPFKVGGRAIDGALAAVDDGDRFDLAGDLYRRVWVNNSANIAINTEAASVTTTAAEVLATPLAGRKQVTVQNRGSQSVFLVESGATAKTDGIEIPKNASATFDFGEDINIFLVADSGTQDVRLLEVA